MGIYHRLLVVGEGNTGDDGEAIEDVLRKVEDIFAQYDGDIIYFNLKIVFEYLRLLYYNHYKVYRQFEKFYDEVNEETESLMSHYSLYTFPSQLLLVKIQRALRLNRETELYEESENLFPLYEPDEDNLPNLITFDTYKAIGSFYSGDYENSARLFNNLLNSVNFRKHPFAMMEIKVLLALQYCMVKDHELFQQTVNSAHRLIRAAGKENCGDIVLFIKGLRLLIHKGGKDKPRKLEKIAGQLERVPMTRPFSPLRLIRLSPDLIVEEGANEGHKEEIKGE
jgi:hypothetical protein